MTNQVTNCLVIYEHGNQRDFDSMLSATNMLPNSVLSEEFMTIEYSRTSRLTLVHVLVICRSSIMIIW